MTARIRRLVLGWSIGFCILAASVHPRPARNDGPPALFPNPWQGPMAAFLTQRARPDYPPDRPVDIEHMVLRLKVDPMQRSIEGSVIYRGTVLWPDLRKWTLDAGPDLSIDAVTLNGQPVRHTHYQEQLVMEWADPLPAGATVEVQITYHGHPQRGLYFVGPDVHPDWPVQVWSQGEAIDHHFWLPIHDAPNERFTTESYWTVPVPMMAIANGRLIEVTPAPDRGWQTFHWKESVPHVPYLISVVIGEFQKFTDTWEGIPVEYYVPRGFTETDVRRSFAKTPAMLAFFSETTGYRYPYEKYAQTTVYNFTFGGMENISATTLWVETLHDERAHPEFQSDGLVAHELAHQWFGDLLTCEHWAHLWLNESFATFMTGVWFGHDRGPDHYDWSRWGWWNSYINEAKRYQRPIVWNVYTYPDDMFDRHTYPKGASILHALRTYLGESLFWKGIRHYVRKFAAQTVETRDLREALEEATGRDLTAFFDQWIYRAGHPKLQIRHRWDPLRKELVVDIEQVQDTGPWIPIFRFATTLEVTTDQGKRSFPIRISRKSETFRFPLDAPPRMILLDPGRNWLMEQIWEKSVDEWSEQLHHAASVFDRAVAARELGKIGDADAVRALADALTQEPFYGVRMEIASALGKTEHVDAVRALERGLDDPDARVRRAVITALRDLEPDARIARRLAEMYDREPVYGVRAAIIRTLVKWQKTRAWKWIERGLKEPAHLDRIQSAALRALADLKDDRPKRVRQLLKTWTRPGHPVYARIAAIETLGKLDPDDTELTAFLERYMFDPVYRVRAAAIRTVAQRGHARSRTAMERVIRSEPNYRLRTTAIRFIERLERKRARRAAA